MTVAVSAPPVTADALATLRQYAALAPWSLRDLSALAGAILESSSVYPVNAAASARPSERTIRFYVTRKLVSPPEGRGTAATYGYRHLLQVLAIKLQQMEGATLDTLVTELGGLPGDVVERRVAASLGSRLPPPDQLPLTVPEGAPRGKVGRALVAWASHDGPLSPRRGRGQLLRRVTLGPGAELLLDDRNPLFDTMDDERIAELFRRALEPQGDRA
ncbi:MAG TPA: MerR family transcriptional regulator [Gemmatimonadales bacterium]|nr:MerR family transcriptional regulator [Gemmatimonadales bacterium]